MADLPSKKAKIVARAPRIRYTLELAVEPGMEEQLEQLKGKIQRVKECLWIAGRTPMGNVIVMERLLDAFEQSKQNGMVSGNHSSLFTAQSFSPSSHLTCNTASQTDVCGSYPLPYILCHGENTTGCFDIHTRNNLVEDYFIALMDAMRQLLSPMGSVLSVDFFLTWNRLRSCSMDMQFASVSCGAGHSLRWHSSSVILRKFTVNLR